MLGFGCVRIDRIDRLDDGGVLLIDYKTGETTAPQLQGEGRKSRNYLSIARSR